MATDENIQNWENQMVQAQTLVILKDENGFELFFEDNKQRSWRISQYQNAAELFSVETKEDGKTVHGFVVYYSSLGVRNLYELCMRTLVYPEKTLRDILGEVVKIGKIIIIKKDDTEGFKCCPHIVLQDESQENKKKVVINMWLSKSFLKNNCDKYLA